jgi:hypothetical protein
MFKEFGSITPAFLITQNPDFPPTAIHVLSACYLTAAFLKTPQDTDPQRFRALGSLPGPVVTKKSILRSC